MEIDKLNARMDSRLSSYKKKKEKKRTCVENETVPDLKTSNRFVMVYSFGLRRSLLTLVR